MMQNFDKKRSRLFAFPARTIMISFVLVILVGSVLLMLPFSSKSREFTGFLDALFTATSATCVTGLIVFDTFTHWSYFGQVVILSLIQVGGLGLVTLTSFISMAIGRKMGLRSMQLAQESVNSSGLETAGNMVRMVVKTSMAFELLGALLLCITFVPQYGLEGVWISVFLSVSAFCNAGFDILGRQTPYISLCNYNGNLMVTGVIMALIIAGGLGFYVWQELFAYFRTKKLSLHTRVVLIVTGILIGAGFLVFAVFEWNNPATMGGLSWYEKFTGALFQSVTLRTAGFNSVPTDSFRPITEILSGLIMLVGAAPGSTAGGIKVTTLAVLMMTIVSVARGRDDTIILKRRINKETVYKSLTIILIAIMAVATAAGVMVGTMGESHSITGSQSFFEACSAFATVGISCGVTGMANIPSKIVLILLMFLGRVGPVSFVLSFAAKPASNKKEVIPEGRIMVG
ncbi:TrkH family potassium uptake protein [Merdimmobilis hominis]|uniref:Ktr system potassium uptake protein B n=1 Tax=uncultured Anaerotruncus sp. TaxID=905011 RepID=A0A6N2U0J2_9FIRM|nr:potassium transporter TrkG [Merdimmobilis hominis]MCD4835530.1 potassium transporter Trk [Merdimmobilis hominis]PWL62171.1 MAG: potassium transporter Trk [Oscillospiraceae bacterium]